MSKVCLIQPYKDLQLASAKLCYFDDYAIFKIFLTLR